jgi:hypothetical protein
MNIGNVDHDDSPVRFYRFSVGLISGESQTNFLIFMSDISAQHSSREFIRCVYKYTTRKPRDLPLCGGRVAGQTVFCPRRHPKNTPSRVVVRQPKVS